MRVRGRKLLAATVLALGALAAPAAAQTNERCAAWMDASKPAAERTGALLAAMSLDNKLEMLTFDSPPWLLYFGTAGHVNGQPELCIPTLNLSDAGSGVAGLQINTTTFPSGVAQAAAWNPGLQRRFGRAVGREAWRKGINVMLAPGMNMARIATNGRNFEYFGEDPFLAGKTAAAVIRGIQSEPVLATAKHYAANEQETDRNTVSAEVGERTLREIYLPPFEASVKEGGVASLMCAYNKLNGVYACENPELLTGFPRRDWGWDGFVMSDWGATHSTVEAALAGLDMEMHAVPPQYFGEPLRQAVADGRVPAARIDEMVRRILTPMFRYGLFDRPIEGQPAPFLADVSTPADRALARDLGAESTVLLKNDRGLLPIEGRGRTIGVIGYAANPLGAANSSSGGGSSRGSGVPAPVSPLEGMLRQAAANGDRVLYAPGETAADAAAVAAASDIAVVFAADSLSEGSDRPDLSLRPGICVTLFCTNLPLDQEAMIRRVAAANERTIVVLDVGGPVAMPWLDEVEAVLLPWYGGSENGNAIASVIYGESEPSGRLPQTFPKAVDDMPARTREQYPGVDGKASYSEGLFVGYRWFDSQRIEPLFPFGYGLSYTTFERGGLRVARSRKGARVTFAIRNTGGREGADVGQIYVGFPRGSGEPPKQLKGYAKLLVPAGESRSATVELDRRAFAYWDQGARRWRVARGCYSVMLGSSAAQIHQRRRLSAGGARCGRRAVRLGRRLVGTFAP